MSTENEQLGKEVAALRTLLAAVRDLAYVPRPADVADWWHAEALTGRRADLIAIYANPDQTVGTGPCTPAMLQDAAEALRKEGARPLRYTPKAAEPVITDSEIEDRCPDHDGPIGSSRCIRAAGHDAAHYNSDGTNWGTPAELRAMRGPDDLVAKRLLDPPVITAHAPAAESCGVEIQAIRDDGDDCWVCTEDAGHAGDHIAKDIYDHEVHRWPVAEPVITDGTGDGADPIDGQGSDLD